MCLFPLPPFKEHNMTETKEELAARHASVVKEIAKHKKLMERCTRYSSRSKKAKWIGSLEFNRLTIEGKMAEFGLTGKNKLDILRNVITISSGTLARLFGTNLYDEIDA